jgi:hypothetical protein
MRPVPRFSTRFRRTPASLFFSRIIVPVCSIRWLVKIDEIGQRGYVSPSQKREKRKSGV